MYDQILVALDGSESSRHSGQAALVLAATRKENGNVLICFNCRSKTNRIVKNGS